MLASIIGSHAILVTILAGAVAGGTSILYCGARRDDLGAGRRDQRRHRGNDARRCPRRLRRHGRDRPGLGRRRSGAAAGALLATVHAWVVVYRNASQLATGLAVLFMALGVTSLYGASFVSSDLHGFTPWRVPLLGGIRLLGPTLFDHDPLVYLSYAAVPATWFCSFRSRWGLLIRTAV